ncbi:MAG: hydrogenase [Candidatus Thermoplasmatota archaeon]
MIEQLEIGQLKTVVGYWNAIIWIIALIVIGLSIYAIRNLGKREYKKGTEQTRPFLSGTIEYDRARVPGENVYWGLVEALKGYYTKLVPAHTGIVSDYISLLVIVLAVLLIIITLAAGGLR